MKISGIFDNASLSFSWKSLQQIHCFISTHKFLMAKLVISVLMLLFFSHNSVNLFPFHFHSEEKINCIYDASLIMTSPINQFFESNLLYKRILIAYSSFLMDLQFLFIMITFCCLARNLRFILIFTSFYVLRGILQSLFVFSFPEDYIWSHPGIFSLTISYAKTSDFFYSGHVGSSVLCIFEFSRFEFFDKRFAYFKYFSINCCITQCLVQIIFRGHYLIDVISGFVFAHYFFILVGDQIDNIEDDRKILLQDWRQAKRKEMKEKRICRKCKKNE